MGIRGIAGGVGLISESIKANKESKGKAAERTAQDSGSAARWYSEGDSSRPIRDSDAIADAPPNYTEASRSKSGQHQYPADKQTGHLKIPKQDGVIEREDNLEYEWALDDAQDQIVGESQDKEANKDTEKLADRFIRNHPTPVHAQRGNLALPSLFPNADQRTAREDS